MIYRPVETTTAHEHWILLIPVPKFIKGTHSLHPSSYSTRHSCAHFLCAMADLLPGDSKESIKGVQASAEPADQSISNGEMDWTVAEETAVRRKFDMVVTPLCTVLYLCCAIDRYVVAKSSQCQPSNRDKQLSYRVGSTIHCLSRVMVSRVEEMPRSKVWEMISAWWAISTILS